MIHSIYFKNFYSFRELNSISFEVNELAPPSKGYFQSNTNTRLTKIMGVIGANASGKTNLLKVLPFIKYFILASFSHSAVFKAHEIPIMRHLGTDKNSPTEVGVQFETKGVLYDYFLKVDREKVFEEELRAKRGNKFFRLFKRVWVGSKKRYDYDFKNYSLSKMFKNAIVEKNLINENASVISTLADVFKHEISKDLTSYWEAVGHNLRESGREDHHGNNYGVDEISEFLKNNAKVRKTIEDLIMKFDLGLVGLDLSKMKFKGKQKETDYSLCMHHLGDTNPKYPLPFRYESSGTRSLLKILTISLTAMKKGSPVILDEFDANLHPNMIPALLALFSSKTINPNNSQLFFSTHHFEVLKSMDKYQILLVEKDNHGNSYTWRLDNMKGVRSDDNYYAKYIAGAYGAVPNISI